MPASVSLFPLHLNSFSLTPTPFLFLLLSSSALPPLSLSYFELLSLIIFCSLSLSPFCSNAFLQINIHTMPSHFLSFPLPILLLLSLPAPLVCFLLSLSVSLSHSFLTLTKLTFTLSSFPLILSQLLSYHHSFIFSLPRSLSFSPCFLYSTIIAFLFPPLIHSWTPTTTTTTNPDPIHWKQNLCCDPSFLLLSNNPIWSGLCWSGKEGEQCWWLLCSWRDVYVGDLVVELLWWCGWGSVGDEVTEVQVLLMELVRCGVWWWDLSSHEKQVFNDIVHRCCCWFLNGRRCRILHKHCLQYSIMSFYVLNSNPTEEINFHSSWGSVE